MGGILHTALRIAWKLLSQQSER